MFEPPSLREQAAEFRAIARDISDKALRHTLVRLALTYDAVAHRIDIGRAIARV